MRVSRRFSLALVAAGICCLLCTTAALAASPSTVTVRVEGLTETKLLPTQVTTTAEPVVKDGVAEDSCSGTSTLGALQLATDGNWSGPWEPGFHQYEIDSIEGESHPFFSGEYWNLWINHVSSEKGACEAELQSGEEVVFAPCSETSECPGTLGIEAPASAGLGESVQVTVEKYDSTGHPLPMTGATVTGAELPTNSSGQTTVRFSSRGEVPVRAEAAESIRAETTVCVHQGNDGTCGASAPAGVSSSGTSAGSGVAGTRNTAPFAIVASAIGLHEGGVYRHSAAPRLLQGKVSLTSGLKDVKLRLTRTQRHTGGRRACSYYDGSTQRFHPMRCGAANGKYFGVGSDAAFSYLLPSALAPGRYVLDIQATDAAGDTTTLARGTSRIVFYVR